MEKVLQVGKGSLMVGTGREQWPSIRGKEFDFEEEERQAPSLNSKIACNGTPQGM